MLSNYPPGITGNEPQIAGYPSGTCQSCGDHGPIVHTDLCRDCWIELEPKEYIELIESQLAAIENKYSALRSKVARDEYREKYEPRRSLRGDQ